MTYAIGKNELTCSEPQECMQPATILVTIAEGVELEFCEDHSRKYEDGSD